jgi:hypothetical protein
MELARSSRRYDEYWGAAERADTRLKCKDNTIHHVHSQILSCWSPVLRDMITQQPSHSLVESTHGLAHLLQVPEEGTTWAALLDMLYPTCPLPSSWVSTNSSEASILQRQRRVLPWKAFCMRTGVTAAMLRGPAAQVLLMYDCAQTARESTLRKAALIASAVGCCRHGV